MKHNSALRWFLLVFSFLCQWLLLKALFLTWVWTGTKYRTTANGALYLTGVRTGTKYRTTTNGALYLTGVWAGTNTEQPQMGYFTWLGCELAQIQNNHKWGTLPDWGVNWHKIQNNHKWGTLPDWGVHWHECRIAHCQSSCDGRLSLNISSDICLAHSDTVASTSLYQDPQQRMTHPHPSVYWVQWRQRNLAHHMAQSPDQ